MKLTNRRRSLRTLNASESVTQIAVLALPTVSDALSIQRAIAAVLHAVAEGTLESPRARVLLYGLQIAATNARRIAAEKGSTAEASTAEIAEEDTSIEFASAESASIEIAPAVEAHHEAPPATIAETVASAAIEAVEEEESGGSCAPAGTDEVAHTNESLQTAPSAAPAQTEEAAASATGYTGNARNRLLAFRNQSATS